MRFCRFPRFFMNITVKTVHICRFTDRYYLWNDRFSVLSWKFCPFKGFLDLSIAVVALLQNYGPYRDNQKVIVLHPSPAFPRRWGAVDTNDWCIKSRHLSPTMPPPPYRDIQMTGQGAGPGWIFHFQNEGRCSPLLALPLIF